jgi:glycosyltransferase involved in cell wall biosynthesis
MMHLDARPRMLFPEEYKGFHLIRIFGRIYGIPPFFDPEEILYRNLLRSHPAILSAATLKEMEECIDAFDPALYAREVLGQCDGYELVRYRDSVLGIPPRAGAVDLELEEDRRRAGVIQGGSREEVEERIRRARDLPRVEFAGWLPIFEYSGNCGRHPQFTHTSEPPSGYRFTWSAPPKKKKLSRLEKFLGVVSTGLKKGVAKLWQLVRPPLALFRGGAHCGLRGRWRVLVAVLRQLFVLRRAGARFGPILRFLQSRHFHSQLMLGDYRGLTFLTSMPYTFGQNPWMVEIEDPITLFYPLIQNGHTSDLAIRESPYYPIIKSLLESDQCKGILTHMKSTAEMVRTLFASEKIAAKVAYTPLGVKLPARCQRHEELEPEHLDLVFINSWCQIPENFYVRGGLDVLEAFAILRERYPHLRLTLRSHLPVLDDHYLRIIDSGWVRVINRFLPGEEMDALLSGSHIFLLPAARVHIVSLLQAMSYGLAVVTSDGWGIEEYVEHERNGLIVKGCYGKASWADKKTGILREDYDFMHTSDPEVVEGIVAAVSRLVEDPHLRRHLGRSARRNVETNYTMERWNQGLKEALDKATARACPAEASGVVERVRIEN